MQRRRQREKTVREKARLISYFMKELTKFRPLHTMSAQERSFAGKVALITGIVALITGIVTEFCRCSG